jgi:hypothetical protein
VSATPGIGGADRADASTADERWSAWVAIGAEHDRKIKRRAIAAAVFVTGVGLCLAIVLLLG